MSMSPLDIPQPPNNFKLLPTQDYNPAIYDEPSDAQIMKKNRIKNKESGQLFRIVVLASIFFILLSQPVVYKITHKIAQYLMSSPINIMYDDKYTTTGTLVHGVLFFIIMLFIVYA